MNNFKIHNLYSDKPFQSPLGYPYTESLEKYSKIVWEEFYEVSYFKLYECIEQECIEYYYSI